MVAAVLVVGVLLMAGPPVPVAAPASAPMSAMAAMDGMTAGAVELVLPGPSSDGAVVTTCAAMCDDLLEACVAVLTLLVVAAMALPGVRRLVRAGPRPFSAVRARWWVLGEPPPWSVPSLSQLSVLRV